MRVAMYYNNRDVRLEELPRPKTGAGELLVRVKASGICGSDLMEWYRRHKAPLVLGHEVAGEIAEIGAGVEGFREGQRVVIAHHVPCMHCFYCRNDLQTMCDTLRRTNFDPGGFSEYVRMPAINVPLGVFPIPDGMSDDVATFVEPLGCVVRGLRRARFRAGMSVLVLGSGIAGQLFVGLAAGLGARRVVSTDLIDFRLEVAKRMGADGTLRADTDVAARFRELNEGLGADLVILTAGAPPVFEQAFASVERGGTILVFAPTAEGVKIPLAVNDLFWRADRTITTSYGAAPADHFEAMDLLAAGRVPVERMITHRLGLAEAQEGFRLMMDGASSVKVILQP